MSYIDKLLIQGIRNFGPQGTNVIEFFHPLTVIVGPNGSGKTTVIECLRYISTGELPPGSKGGAFIHDPKVAGETEVLAQIKLKMHNVAGQVVVVTRRLQASQKKKKIEMKTLEGLIQRIDPSTGMKSSLSSKCGDLDREMASLLGVSKAVLSNVIFCHQEDSNWPLDEGRELKKRFDDIFSATRYIKALEAIKKFRAEQMQILRETGIELKFLLENKEKAAELRKAHERTLHKIEEAELSIQKLAEKLQPIDQQIDSIRRQSSHLNTLQTDLAKAVSGREELQKQADTLCKSITNIYDEVEMTNARLEEKRLNFQRSFEQRRSEIQTLERQLELDDRARKQAFATMTQLRTEQGKLSNAAEEHNKKLEQRDQLLREFIRKHKLALVIDEGRLSGDMVRSCMQSGATRLSAARDEVNRLKASFREDDAARQGHIEELKAKLARLKQAQQSCEQGLSSHRSKMSALQQQMRSVDRTAGTVDAAEANHQALVEQLNGKRQLLRSDEVDSAITRLEKELTSLAVDQRDIAALLDRMNEQSRQRIAVDHKKGEIQQKQQQINDILRYREAEFVAALSAVPAVHMLTNECRKKLQAAQTSCDAINARLSEHQKKLAGYRAEMDMHRRQIGDSESSIAAKRDRITAVCGSKPFATALAEAQQALSQADQDLGLVKNASEVYQRFLDKARSSHNCPLCRRGFDNEPSLNEFVDMLNTTVTLSLPGRQTDLAAKKAAAQASFDRIEALNGDVTEIARLETHVSETRKKLVAKTSEHDALRRVIDDTEMEVGGAQAEASAIRDLLPECEHIQRLQSEIESLSTEVSTQQARYSGAEGEKSIDQVKEEERALNEKRAFLAKQLETTKSRRDQLRLDIANCERTVATAETQLNKAQSQRDTIRRLELQLEENQKQQQQLMADQEAARSQLDPLEHQLEAASLARKQQEHQCSKNLNTIEAVVSSLSSEIAAIEAPLRAIHEYEAMDKDRQMVENQNTVRRVEAEIAAIDTRMQRNGQQKDQYQRETANEQVLEREIQDNIRLRDCRKSIQERMQLESQLRSQLDREGLPNMSRTFEQLERQRDELLSRQAAFRGTKTTLEQQAAAETAELQSASMRNVDEKHRDCYVKVKTTELANSDLNKYYGALDRAIMDYHSHKMEEINKIIKELWVSTYVGNDIDYIAIRSDAEDDTDLRDANSRKTYHYRVVMIKNDTEMDMRGRCSAGQKVLAALIIRLALAETFCINCGVLTLDEPTTNLDGDNIESLARSLSAIVESRKRQHNFQLVIITHDEEFLDKLHHTCGVPSYYRISKDEHGCSEIKLQSSAELRR